jgi:hypothetical protein
MIISSIVSVGSNASVSVSSTSSTAVDAVDAVVVVGDKVVVIFSTILRLILNSVSGNK